MIENINVNWWLLAYAKVQNGPPSVERNGSYKPFLYKVCRISENLYD